MNWSSLITYRKVRGKTNSQPLRTPSEISARYKRRGCDQVSVLTSWVRMMDSSPPKKSCIIVQFVHYQNLNQVSNWFLKKGKLPLISSKNFVNHENWNQLARSQSRKYLRHFSSLGSIETCNVSWRQFSVTKDRNKRTKLMYKICEDDWHRLSNCWWGFSTELRDRTRFDLPALASCGVSPSYVATWHRKLLGC